MILKELRTLYATVRESLTSPEANFNDLLAKIPAHRSQLRRWIEEVGWPDARHLLVVTGERGSGKSYTMEILSQFSSTGRFQMVALDLARATEIKSAEDLLRAIGLESHWDIASIPNRGRKLLKAYHQQGTDWLLGSLKGRQNNLVVVLDGLDSLDVTEDVRTFIDRLAGIRFPSNLNLVLIDPPVGSLRLQSLKNATVELIESTPKGTTKLPRLNVLVVGTGTYELPSPVHKAAFQVGSAVGRLNYGLITGGWAGVDHVAARAFAEARTDEKTSLVDRLLQIVEGNQNPDFTGGAIERVVIGEGYNAAIERADIVVLIGGAGGTWVAFRHALAANRPVIPLMKTETDAEAAGKLLLVLGQYVSRDLIAAEFEDDAAAVQSGRLIQRYLLNHNKQTQASIDNSNLLWMVDTILPTADLYLRKKSGYEREASEIREGFQSIKMPDTTYQQLTQTLVESSDRSWRVAGYLAIEGRPSHKFFNQLLVSQGLEEKKHWTT